MLDPETLPSGFLDYNPDPPWLAALPKLLDELARRWSLTLGPHYSSIRINYVAPATRSDGTRCVLKVSRFVDETLNEIAAVRLWDGDGCCRLLEADESIGALLIEMVEPGTTLVDDPSVDDEAATRITADLLRQLWRPVPPGWISDPVGRPVTPVGPAAPSTAPTRPAGLRSLASWHAAYDRNRAALRRGEGGFPAALFDRADELRRELLDSTAQDYVLHGDMHHFNVLRARRAPWLAIDPKGLAGDRHFDLCQFLRNPYPEGATDAQNRRRLDIFCEGLGLDRARAVDWCLVHAVLDACWSFEDGEDWRPAVEYAEKTQRY